MAAIRKAVIINPISSERKKSFYAFWSYMRQRINLGDSETQVRRHLGVPDVEAIGTDSGLWIYGVLPEAVIAEKCSKADMASLLV